MTCLDPELTTPNISDWKVYSGDYFLSAKDSAEKSHEVQKIIMHENYTIVTQDVQNTYFALVNNDIGKFFNFFFNFIIIFGFCLKFFSPNFMFFLKKKLYSSF